LGVEVEKEAMDVIRLFERAEVYYLEVGILEAVWSILKRVPHDKLSRVKVGIEAIRNTYHLLKPSEEAYIKAIDKRRSIYKSN